VAALQCFSIVFWFAGSGGIRPLWLPQAVGDAMALNSASQQIFGLAVTLVLGTLCRAVQDSAASENMQWSPGAATIRNLTKFRQVWRYVTQFVLLLSGLAKANVIHLTYVIVTVALTLAPTVKAEHWKILSIWQCFCVCALLTWQLVGSDEDFARFFAGVDNSETWFSWMEVIGLRACKSTRASRQLDGTDVLDQHDFLCETVHNATVAANADSAAKCPACTKPAVLGWSFFAAICTLIQFEATYLLEHAQGTVDFAADPGDILMALVAKGQAAQYFVQHSLYLTVALLFVLMAEIKSAMFIVIVSNFLLYMWLFLLYREKGGAQTVKANAGAPKPALHTGLGHAVPRRPRLGRF